MLSKFQRNIQKEAKKIKLAKVSNFSQILSSQTETDLKISNEEQNAYLNEAILIKKDFDEIHLIESQVRVDDLKNNAGNYRYYI